MRSPQLGEITGCFAFWAWLRLGKSPLWTLPGVVSLVIFALALTRIDAAAAGRAYAAYGGIYPLSRRCCGCGLLRGSTPRPMGCDRRRGICFIGAAVILLGPRDV